MKKPFLAFPLHLLILLLVVVTSCNGQNETNQISKSKSSFSNKATNQFGFVPENEKNTCTDKSTDQIAEYIKDIAQDQWGNYWFATQGRGLALNMGNSLMYFTEKDGLTSNQINEISIDTEGLVWLATGNGVSSYSGAGFSNYTIKDGLLDNQVQAILADSKGGIWAATKKGVCKFNGTSFVPFEIPKPDIENPTFKFSLENVWEIFEDSNGNIWFARDGYGATKYDGKSFTHYTQKDGLRGNDVASIAEDKNGNMWFGTIATRVPSKENKYHYIDSKNGGLTKFDGKEFTQFTDVEGLTANNIHTIYTDKKGDVWIISKHFGVFKYDGENFKLYKEENLPNNCVQSVLEDKEGEMWFGFSGGLFKLNNDEIENVPLNSYEYNNDPYRLKLRIENVEESKGNKEYTLRLEMVMDDSAHYVSPNSPGSYKGIFNVSLNNTENLVLDDTITETPKSIESTDPFTGDPVNFVTENTVHTMKIKVKTTKDFEVNGTVRFVIEPNCTLEENTFKITYTHGELKIKRTDNKGC